MLGVLPLASSVVTADAVFTHADFEEKILDGVGDYLPALKDDRPASLADAAPAFETPKARSPPRRRLLEADRHEARELDKGLGRREVRTLTSSTILNGQKTGPA